MHEVGFRLIGPEFLAFVPILLVLIISHECGHFFMARATGVVVEEFAIGFPPRLWSKEWGGVRYSLNALPIGAYVRLKGEDDPTGPGSFASASRLSRALILAAGSLVNFLLAVLIFALAYGIGAPDPRNAQVLIEQVAPGSPAEAAGLIAGDVLLSVDGQPLRGVGQLQGHVRDAGGRPITIELERQGNTRSVQVTPRVDPPPGQGALGVGLGLRILPTPHDPITSLVFGVRQAVAVVALTIVAPIEAIRGQVPLELLRPVGLPGMSQIAAGATAAVVQSGWFFPVLFVAGVFSAGLAVANMLPLPALDGGRLMFIAIEAIRGRPVPPRLEGLIHTAGLMILVTLMVAISFNDILRPVPPIDWGLP